MENLWKEIAPVAVCISTEKCHDRRTKCAKEFNSVDISHVKFVINEIDPEDGMRGCFNAHRNVALNAYIKGVERLLVFEDDVIFASVDQVKKALTDVSSFIKSNTDWDILYLGHAACRPIYPTKHKSIVTSADFRFMHAVVWSRRGMAKFLRLEYEGSQLDSTISQSTYAFAPYPMVAFQADMQLSGVHTLKYSLAIYLRSIIGASNLCKILEKVLYSIGSILHLFSK